MDANWPIDWISALKAGLASQVRKGGGPHSGSDLINPAPSTPMLFVSTDYNSCVVHEVLSLQHTHCTRAAGGW